VERMTSVPGLIAAAPPLLTGSILILAGLLTMTIFYEVMTGKSHRIDDDWEARSNAEMRRELARIRRDRPENIAGRINRNNKS
jgi:hypothetical protein